MASNKKEKKNSPKLNLLAVLSGLFGTFIVVAIIALGATFTSEEDETALFHKSYDYVQVAPQAIEKEIVTAPIEDMSVQPVAAPDILVNNRGIISLIVVDYGLSPRVTKTLHDAFPEYTTFAVSPYAQKKNIEFDKARFFNQEFWGYAPLKDQFNVATGPLDIVLTSTIEEREKRVAALSKLFKDYLGALTYGDGKLKGELMNAFNDLKIPFVYFDKNNFPVLYFSRFETVASQKNAIEPFLEDVITEKKRGAIIVEPGPAIIDEINELVSLLKNANIQIVPLSALLK